MRFARAAAVLLLLASTGVSGPAEAAPAGAWAAPAGPDEVYAALGVDGVPADLVVMVDVSGSMKGARYAQLKRSLTEFFAALAPEDQVTLIPFDGRATAVTSAVGRAPGRLAARLPKDATGQDTDIGAALEKGVEALGRAGAPPLATVVLLTDGRHEPGPGSAYPLTQGHNWDQLAVKAAKLDKTALAAYAVPLSGATGAGLLKKVFPDASVLAPSSVDALTATLARPKAAARAAKARSILAAEITRPVTVSWPATPLGAGTTILGVRVRSPMPHVPLALDGLAVTGDNPAVTVSVPAGPVDLPPGGEVTVPVTVTWDAGPVSAAPVRTVAARVNLRLTGQVTSPWGTVLTRDLGLSPQPALAAEPGGVELSADRGSLWWWILGAALLAVLLVALARWRRGRLSPELTGAVLIERAGDDPHTLALSGRRVLLSADAGLPGSGEITAARAGVGSADVQLLISYSPDGSAGSRGAGACAPGATVSVAGTSFTWQAGGPIPGRRGRRTRRPPCRP